MKKILLMLSFCSCALLAGLAEANAESIEHCKAIQNTMPDVYKSLEWSATVDAGHSVKCAGLTVEQIQEEATTQRFGYFLGLQAGGMSDKEIELILEEIMRGEKKI